MLASLLAAALGACAPASPTTPLAAQRATGLAQTAVLVLTSTAAARLTAASPTTVPSTPARTTAAPTATHTNTPSTTATEAAEPPAITLSPTACEHDSAFDSDVTVPDGTHFAPGRAFTKTWRLLNNGVCAWTTDYTFRHVSGEAMGGAPLNLPHAVAPGATVDLSVALTAPATEGRFTGKWQLHSPGGEAFGAKPFVEIVVP
jgi:hypothetical protein